MRLLILITQLERAGAQKVALMLGRFAHNQGHKVTLAFLYDKAGYMADVQAREPFAVINLECKGGSRLGTFGRTTRGLWQLWRLMRRERFDVLFSLTLFSNLLGQPLAWLAGIPVRIASQRNSLPNTPALLLKCDAALVNSRIVTLITTPSQKTHDFCVEVEGMRAEKVRVVPNGVSVPQRPNHFGSDTTKVSQGFKKPARFTVLTVARLHPQKGLGYLIEAAHAVVKQIEDAQFLIVGEGALRDELMQQIVAANLSEHVLLLGARDDVPELLQQADLFLLSSLYEGMSNALLEAMVAGLPVLATDVDGTRELLRHGETGFVVPPADVNALVAGLHTLLTNADLRMQLGVAGQAYVTRHFSADASHQAYLSLFQALLDRKTPKQDTIHGDLSNA